MRFRKIITSVAVVLFLLSSCTTPKNITYFQDVTDGQKVLPQSAYGIKVRPDDKLSIIVTAQDPNISALFNLVQTQNRLTSTSTTVGQALNTTDSRTGYYTVDSDGDINFPVLGKLHIEGMKRAEVAAFIEKRLKVENLVKDPVVTVEFINTGVAVLGEVVRPGRYEFNQDRITIMEALSMAGDLKNTGQRENVMLVRDNGGEQQVYTLDLTKAKEVMSSPAYYIQQNDVIYVEPNKRAKRETTSQGNTLYSPSFWVSVGSVAISVATLITTLSK